MEAIWPVPIGVTWEDWRVSRIKNPHAVFPLVLLGSKSSKRALSWPVPLRICCVPPRRLSHSNPPAAPPQRIDPGLHVGEECTMTAQAAGRIYRTWMKRWRIQERFPKLTGASSICGSLENCLPCTYRQLKWKRSSAWEAQISLAVMATQWTTCDA